MVRSGKLFKLQTFQGNKMPLVHWSWNPFAWVYWWHPVALKSEIFRSKIAMQWRIKDEDLYIRDICRRWPAWRSWRCGRDATEGRCSAWKRLPFKEYKTQCLMLCAKILTQRSSTKKLTYPIDCDDSECYPVNDLQIIAIYSNRHVVVLWIRDSFSIFVDFPTLHPFPDWIFSLIEPARLSLSSVDSIIGMLFHLFIAFDSQEWNFTCNETVS